MIQSHINTSENNYVFVLVNDQIKVYEDEKNRL